MKRFSLWVLLGIFLTNIHGFKQEKVFLQVPVSENSKDMLVRNAELTIRPNALATVILFHGFKGDKNSIRGLRILFSRYNTLIFDFRAHGDNIQGQCCSFGAQERLDVKAAVDYVKNHSMLKDKPIFAYGMSMGAASVIEAQAHYGDLFKGIIADSPFDSIESVVERGLKKVTFIIAGYDFIEPIRLFFKKYAFDKRIDQLLHFFLSNFAGMNASTTPTCLCPVSPCKSIKKVTIPTLLIVCENDEQVPLEAVKMIHQQSPILTQLWVAPGRGHIDAFFSNPEEYADRINNFIDEIMG